MFLTGACHHALVGQVQLHELAAAAEGHLRIDTSVAAAWN